MWANGRPYILLSFPIKMKLRVWQKCITWLLYGAKRIIFYDICIMLTFLSQTISFSSVHLIVIVHLCLHIKFHLENFLLINLHSYRSSFFLSWLVLERNMSYFFICIFIYLPHTQIYSLVHPCNQNLESFHCSLLFW